MDNKNQVRVKINPSEHEGMLHLGKVFIVVGEPRMVCGTKCVALDNLDGSRFSAAYDLSMLQPA